MPISLINFLIGRTIAQNQGVTDPQRANQLALPAAILPGAALGVGLTTVLARQDVGAQSTTSAPPAPGPGPSPSPSDIEVPQVTFRADQTRYAADEAGAILKRYGLNPDPRTGFSSSGVAKDHVISQAPEPPDFVRLG